METNAVGQQETRNRIEALERAVERYAELCDRHEQQLNELWPTLGTQPWYRDAKAALQLAGSSRPLTPQPAQPPAPPDPEPAP